MTPVYRYDDDQAQMGRVMFIRLVNMGLSPAWGWATGAGWQILLGESDVAKLRECQSRWPGLFGSPPPGGCRGK